MSSLAQVRMMFNSPEAFSSPLLARTSLLLLLQSTRPSSGYMRFHEWPGQCECGRSLILCHLNKTGCYCFSGVNNGASKNLQGRARGGIKGTPELVAAKQLFREHFRFQWPLELTLVAVTVMLVCYNVSCAVLQNRAWQPFLSRTSQEILVPLWAVYIVRCSPPAVAFRCKTVLACYIHEREWLCSNKTYKTKNAARWAPPYTGHHAVPGEADSNQP